MLALLLMLQAAPASDVVVIANKLDRFRAQMAYGKSGAQCRIKTSTGDAEIDAVGCKAIEVCWPSFDSRMAATDDRAIKPSTRKIMRSALNDELRGCFATQTKAGIAALTAKRAAS
ncbi:MAG: hypothetical protein V4537_04620 [Pseudomonadota bacterium]